MDNTNLDRYKFSSTYVESLLKASNLEQDETFLKSLLPCGYNYQRPAKSYPFSVVVCLAETIIANAMPTATIEAAALELGKRWYHGLQLTVLGRVLTAAFRIVSLERALALSVLGLNGNIGFGQRRLTQLARNHYRIEFEDNPGG